MKRASYRKAIELIGENDEPCELDPDAIAGFASVVIVAELFGVSPRRLSEDVSQYRNRRDLAEAHDRAVRALADRRGSL